MNRSRAGLALLLLLSSSACRPEAETTTAPASTRATQTDPGSTEGLFLASLRRNLPACEATRKDARTYDVSCDDVRLQVNLENLEAETKGLSSVERIAHVDSWVAALAAAMRDSNAPGSVEQLVPLVRPTSMREAFAGASDVPLTEPLAGGLMVVYGFDQPAMVRMAKASELEAFNLGPDLRKTALENLAAALPRPQVHAGENVMMVTWGGTYEASLLLYAGFWDAAADEVAGDVVAVAPARDLLFFTGSENPAGLEKLRSVLDQVEHDEQVSHRLSPIPMRWHEGRWVDFTGW